MARILVVDDSGTLRKVVASILTRHGHDADVAADGMEALDRLRASGPYELVLLDFVMPRMNGYQFCRALRDDQALCAQPVVLMSAKSDKIRETFVRQTGALDAISKPFDAQALVVVVDNALRRVERGHQSQARIELEPEEPISIIPPNLEDTQARVAAALGEELGRALSSAPPPAPFSPSVPPPAQSSPSFSSTGNVQHLAGSLGSLLTPEILQKLAGALKDLEVAEPPPLLEGDLGVIPIGAVLQMIQMERLTGVLTVKRGDPPRPNDAPVEVTVTMRLGLVDLAQSKGTTTDEFRLGRHFLEAGLTTPTDIGILVSGGELDMPPELTTGATPAIGVTPAIGLSLTDDQSETAAFPELPTRTLTEPVNVVEDPAGDEPALLGDQLLRYGRISKEQLKLALTRQSSELLYEVLRWGSGRFELRKKIASASARRARLGLAVPSVVMEGFRRVDEWRLLEKKLGSFDDVLLRDEVALAALGALGDDTIEKVERTVLDAIDGKRSIREVVAASHLSSFDACRVLVQLLEARLVRRTT